MSIISGLTSLSLLNGLINQANNNLPPDMAELVGWWKASDLAAAQNSAAVSSPLAIGNVAAWFRADMGITNVAGSVTAWADQTGTDSNKNLVGTGHTPTFNSSDASYNGTPTISFASASTEYLISGTWSSSVASPRTVFVVGNFDGTTNNEFMLDDLTVNHNAISNASAATFVSVNGGTARNITVPSNSVPLIISMVVQVAGAGYVNGSTAGTLGSLGTQALTGLNVGIAGNGTVPLNGKVAEIIVFNIALSATQINQVNCYLSNRYAIPLKQSAWKDKLGADSTHNLAQATYANQPTLIMSDGGYNNQPSVAFLASATQYFNSVTFTTKATIPYTIFVVANTSDAAGSEVLIQPASGNTAYIYTGSGAHYIFYAGTAVNVGVPNTSPTIFGVVNQGNVTSTQYLSAKTPAQTGDLGSSICDGLAIGAEQSGSDPWNGKVAEVLIYNAALSSAQINAVLAELGATYNISIGS